MRRNSDAPVPFTPRPSGDRSRPKPFVPSGRGGRATLDDDGNSTCLSALPHDPDADRDSLFQHFLGCLEFHERASFLDYEANRFWKEQAQEVFELEISKREAMKESFVEENLKEEAEEQVKKSIQDLAISIEAQYKRTEVLRQALSKQNFTEPAEDGSRSRSETNPTPQSQVGPQDQTRTQADPSIHPPRNPGIRVADAPEPKSLIWYIDQSRDAWRSSDEYKEGIKKVRAWRGTKGLPIDTDTANIDGTGGPAASWKEPGREKVRDIVRALRGDESIKKEVSSDYSLQRDVNAYLIQYTRQPTSPAIADTRFTARSPPDPRMSHLPARPWEENLEDVRFKGKFPDQRLSVDLLLGSAHAEASLYKRDVPQKSSASNGAHGNILSKNDCDKEDPTRMRYLHIPANNMEWVEVRPSRSLCTSSVRAADFFLERHSRVLRR
jgi:hypothetical protein